MVPTITATCVLCGASFEAHTTYGLCSLHISQMTLREWDRLASASRDAQRQKMEVTLTLGEWLSCISDFKGRCAFCGVMPYSLIQVMRFDRGLSEGNVVPACRSCGFHWQHGWMRAVERVAQYLAEFEEDEDEDETLDEEDGFMRVVEQHAEQFGEAFPNFGHWYMQHWNEHGRRGTGG